MDTKAVTTSFVINIAISGCYNEAVRQKRDNNKEIRMDNFVMDIAISWYITFPGTYGFCKLSDRICLLYPSLSLAYV